MLMKYRFMLSALFLALAPAALASNTWYVNGVTGSDSNDCTTATTACKTIGHAISLASSGDTIMVAAATYNENLNHLFSMSLNIVGAGASTTIIDGGGNGAVLDFNGGTVSGVTIQNGAAGALGDGGGIYAGNSLTILNSVISGNSAGGGGGVFVAGGTLTISSSTISGNSASSQGGGVNARFLIINKSTVSGNTSGSGGGIFCAGGGGDTMLISNSTISGNSATSGPGGGILPCNGSITNSTISGNTTSVGGAETGGQGGGMWVAGATVFVNNSTIAGNSAQVSGGGIYLSTNGAATLQNTIVAGNGFGNNCGGIGTFTSNGYNLGGDSTCHFTGPGDLNNANPKLGPLQNNGGPTQTMALGNGSPAIDAGNPTGCTDGKGNLLKFDQRGAPRPDKDDTSGCDIGAYESQN
jgi:hypothetical protein